MARSSLKTNLDIIQQKARERTVKTQNVEYDLDTLIKRINSRTIKLDPDYQRRHRWPIETSSRLIESLILNFPIPVIFISQDIDVDDEIEDNASRFTVIDGQQRLTAIFNFLNNQFALEGLESLQELNGSYYKDLPPFLIRRLEERTVKCLRIDSTVDQQVKFDIFERLNTGSVKLEAQELRNATARGPFNDLTKELAKNNDFRQMIQVDDDDPSASIKVQRMEDAELVLRFFSLKDGRYKLLRKGFKDFLTSSLMDFNKEGESFIKKSKTDFDVYMRFLHEYVGEKPFAKWRIEPNKQKRMSSFNAAVYDAIAVGLSEVYTAEQIKFSPNKAFSALDGYTDLFSDQDFFASVSGSVNDAAKVVLRIDMFAEFIRR